MWSDSTKDRYGKNTVGVQQNGRIGMDNNEKINENVQVTQGTYNQQNTDSYGTGYGQSLYNNGYGTNMNGKSVKEKHTGRAVGGFFLTLFLCLFLIGTVVVGSISTTLLKGGSIKSVFKNLGVSKVIEQAINDELDSIAEDAELPADVVKNLISKDFIDGTLDAVIDTASGAEANLDFIKTEGMKVIDDTVNGMVDVVFEELGKHTGTYDLKNILNNPDIVKLQLDYDVDFEEVLMKESGTTTVNLDEVNLKEMKENVNKEIHKDVYPVLETALDDCIVESKKIIEEMKIEMEAENQEAASAFAIIKNVQLGLKMVNVGLIILIVICVAFAASELLVYKAAMNKGIRNIAIGSIIAGAFVAFIGAVGNMGMSMTRDTILTGGGSIEKVVAENVVGIMAAMFKAMTVAGVILLIISIILFIVAAIVKSSLKKARV